MAQAPLTLGQAADAVDVSIQNYWLKGTDPQEEYFRKFANVTTGVTDYYMKESGLSGLGSAARTVESASIVAEVPVQLNSQTYTQVFYDKLMSFSLHMWKFGIKKRDVQRVVNELKSACQTRREELLAEKLDAGFVTSYTASDDAGNYTVTTSGGDSVAQYSASHTREDGGTAWSNLVSDGTTANLSLDYAALKALDRVAGLQVGAKGKTLDVNPNRIIVKKGTAAAHKAKEISGAIASGKIPEEFSNDGSAVNSFELVETPYLLATGDATSPTNLSSATNWHSLDTSMLNNEYGIQYFESQPIQLDEQNIVYKTKEIQYTSTVAFAYGHNDARGTFGSTGAN